MSLPFIKSKLSLALFTTLALALTGCEKHDSHDTATTPQTNNAPTAKHTDHDHDHDEHDEEHEHGEHDEHDHEGHEHDDDDHDHHEHDHEGHEHGHHHHDEDRIEFDCEPDVTVKVLYHADDQPPMAHVLIDGIDYDFAQLPDTDNRYRSEVGLEEGQAIIWQTQNDGKTATLSSVPLDDMDSVEKEQVVYTCKQDS